MRSKRRRCGHGPYGCGAEKALMLDLRSGDRRALVDPAAGLGGELDLIWRHAVPLRAGERDADVAAAAGVCQFDPCAALDRPLVAPSHERDEHGQEVGALLGERVLVAGTLAGL